MLNKEFNYDWQIDLDSDPETYWLLIADTNRFNKDTGLPTLENLGEGDPSLENARRRLRIYRLGVPVTWVEEPFEWVRPYRFGVVRNYSTGPVAQMRVLAELQPTEKGGTHFRYRVWTKARNLLGLAAIPVQIGMLSAKSFQKIFKDYDAVAKKEKPAIKLGSAPRLAPGGAARMARIRNRLLELEIDAEMVGKLVDTIARGEDLSVYQLRPYPLADYWGMPRQDALKMFLHATREGLLDLRWNLLCPSCRVARSTAPSLRELPNEVHCDTCLIDFGVNFEQSVELVFHPNPAIRQVKETVNFCVAGPQITPHIRAQQLLEYGEQREIRPELSPGQYRIRSLQHEGAQYLRVAQDGEQQATLTQTSERWLQSEVRLAPNPTLTLANQTGEERLFVLEHIEWGDEAVTASEVTSLQTFRDLFANEALRPGDQFSVGHLALVFTDLKASTRMYREIGDAPAFGRVMSHFDILKAAIEGNNGAMVKTIGDAVLAVFRSPGDALHAMQKAQEDLAKEPERFKLKVGMHYGPCIAVNLNERLDYFGTTVNLAARLVEISSGDDLILSDEMAHDPEVEDTIEKMGLRISPVQFNNLKGFEDEDYQLWILRR